MPDSVKLSLQIAAVLFISLLILIPGYFITLPSSVDAMQNAIQDALLLISGDETIQTEQEVDHPQIQSVYRLNNGDRIFSLVQSRSFFSLRLLVRIFADGRDAEYKIVSLENSVNGWERGNGFAFYELANNELSRPRTAFWDGEIHKLLLIAEVYAQ